MEAAEKASWELANNRKKSDLEKEAKAVTFADLSTCYLIYGYIK
jgi:hypothetical protein